MATEATPYSEIRERVPDWGEQMAKEVAVWTVVMSFLTMMAAPSADGSFGIHTVSGLFVMGVVLSGALRIFFWLHHRLGDLRQNLTT
jgi:hypothetical protein